MVEVIARAVRESTSTSGCDGGWRVAMDRPEGALGGCSQWCPKDNNTPFTTCRAPLEVRKATLASVLAKAVVVACG